MLTLHHHPARLLFGADDLDHLVDVEVGNEQAFEDVQASQHLVEAILQAAAHRLAAKLSHSVRMVLRSFTWGRLSRPRMLRLTR